MPTIRQKQAFDKITESHGAMSVGEAMLQAGYDEDTAKKPKNLTESKGWQELMQTYLPDEKLAKVHREGLEATTKKPHLIDRDDKGRPVYEYVEEDDYATRHRYLDSAYKLKGSYAPDKSINLNANVNITPQDEKAKAIAQKYEEELLQNIQVD